MVKSGRHLGGVLPPRTVSPQIITYWAAHTLFPVHHTDHYFDIACIAVCSISLFWQASCRPATQEAKDYKQITMWPGSLTLVRLDEVFWPKITVYTGEFLECVSSGGAPTVWRRKWLRGLPGFSLGQQIVCDQLHAAQTALSPFSAGSSNAALTVQFQKRHSSHWQESRSRKISRRNDSLFSRSLEKTDFSFLFLFSIFKIFRKKFNFSSWFVRFLKLFSFCSWF